MAAEEFAASVTAIVVSFAEPSATIAAVRSLLTQTLPPREILVVDNDPRGRGALALADAALGSLVQVVHPATNLGYVNAANRAARLARGEWLFFLNPDATAQPDCLSEMMRAVDGPDVAIIGAQVLLPDGRVNAGENPLNIAGVSWSGGYGQPREHGSPRDCAAVSGAALLARRESFRDVGGLCPFLFMYMDDSDLAWRVRLNGKRVRFCPSAVVVHEYEFNNGPHKWFYLERNRTWALLSNLQLRTLMLLAPLLLATEIHLFTRAASDKWLVQKVRAWVWVVRELPGLLRWRRAVQATRVVSDYRVLGLFVGAVETNLIETRLPTWVNGCLELYRRIVLRLLEPRQRRIRSNSGR